MVGNGVNQVLGKNLMVKAGNQLLVRQLKIIMSPSGMVMMLFWMLPGRTVKICTLKPERLSKLTNQIQQVIKGMYGSMVIQQ